MKMYRFVLRDYATNIIMGTDVDEPNPQIDAEFWARFMEGDCNMTFEYEYIEEGEEA